MTCAVETDGLCRDFGSRRAVDRLTLRIPAGTIFGLLGPNGAGKTTTIRLLLGLLAPTAGGVRVLGLDPSRAGREVRSLTGALLEHTGLYERLSVEDNLEFFGRAWRLPRGPRRSRIEELLRRTGLGERRREAVGRLSRGMRQRLAIARALLHRPRLLVLDEPTSGLDPIAASEVHEDLRALAKREDVTVLWTTHNLAEADGLCDRIAVLREGTIAAEGTPREIRARRGASRVEIFGRRLTAAIASELRRTPGIRCVSGESDARLAIDLDPDADVAEAVRVIVRAGGEIEELRRDSESLADVFRALVTEDR